MNSLSGDVEVTKSKATNTLSVCHWNLYSISALNYSTPNYSKVSLLKAYLTIHKFDKACLSEIYVYFNTAPDNSNLEVSGNNFIRSDHPINSKCGGVCVSYKHFLHLRVLDIQYLHECINIELKIANKFCFVIAFYRSRRQWQHELEKCSEKLELNLDSLVPKNPFLVVLTGGFNAK